ncbi:MAG: DUF4230 domain-containing protein [Acidimicrobiia bacterium]|nr:DUF4230 domain-containing protein [Acidimicrobiia bacterium]
MTALAALVLVAVTAGVTWWVMPDANSTTTVNVNEIKEISQLSTVEYHITEYYEETLTRKVLGFIPDRKRTKGAVYVNAVVTGSVDFDQAAITIDDSGNRPSVAIMFPEDSFMMKNDIDEGDIVKSDVKDPLLYKAITAEEWTRMQDAALAAVKQTALDTGIKQATARNAEKMLVLFLNSLGYDCEVTFEF